MRLSKNLTLTLGLGALLLLPAYWSTAAPAPPAKVVAPAAGPLAASPEGIEFFEKKVRPLLAERCYACHGAAAKNVGGGLLLDSREGTLKGGAMGPAIVPGKPDQSLLLRAVRAKEGGLKMPPGKPLAASEVADLEAWVKMGAPDPRTGAPAAIRAGYDWEKERQFWSFRPLGQPAVPAVKDTRWPKTAIDRFVLAKLEARGLKPAPDADRRTLIRRVTFDLTGLPPTPEEVRAFVGDRSPNAWEKVVDRLLASPAYGERWGRHWLDLVRYADTSGCNSDFPIPTAHKYRDYVIRAFNADKPYDQLLQEHLAGDLLPAATEAERHEKTIATGYLALARRFGSQANEFHLTIEDTIDNVGKTMLGLSVSCARCHDHKFDPVPQRDYYSLYGIFQSTKYAFPGTEVVPAEKDLVILAAGEEAERARKYDAELNALGPRLFRLRPEVRRLEAAAEEAEQRAEEAQKTGVNAAAAIRGAAERRKAYEEAKVELAQLTERQNELLDNPVKVPKAYAVAEGAPVNARLHRKGDPKALGEETPRGFLQILGGQTLSPGAAGSGRLELARWITDPKNPLTARVMVNRIWQGHFGKGIVATPSDFGARGQKPTHPELLDYLAAGFAGVSGSRFQVSGSGNLKPETFTPRTGGENPKPWSIKAMHREMLLSRTYQLSSGDDPKNMQADVSNSLLWRYHRHRLDAESIRDAMLSVSGALDRSTPAGKSGEHPFPPRREWKYTQHRPFYAVYETNRRSVYLMQQRIKKQPFLETFDGADPNTNTAERSVSTTAIQALFLMNDAFVHEQARKLAERVSAGSPEPSKRVNEAYLLAYGRSATPEELKLCTQYLAECRAELGQAGKVEDPERAALASLMRVILSSNEFVFID